MAASFSEGLVTQEFIYTNAPFPECHASTVVEAGNGFMAAWFGGTREGHSDVGIWSSRLGPNGWSVPVELFNGVSPSEKRYPCWNPVLFEVSPSELWLFYKVGPNPREWWGMLAKSKDQGKTWSAAERLPEGIFGPIKNKPVRLKNGDILCPTSTEDTGWRVHFERTSDLGVTWTATPAVNDGKEFGAIQPSVLFHADGRLQAIGRTRQDVIFQVWSTDNGRSWGKMTATALPNPNSGTDAVTLADGRQLLVYNHTRKGRSPLNVAVSADGVTWQAALVLENKPGEYSYPAVIQAKDGQVHITYTWKRERIRHVVIDPSKMRLRPMEGSAWPQS
jgi:predicted neuraminidase